MFARVFGPTKGLVKLISSENPKSVDLVREVQLLRHSISANMIMKIDPRQRLEFMEQLWTVLLKVAESPEPTVYVSVRSAVGAILFGIFPFFPTMTTQSFSTVVQKMMKVSNASIIVIGAFLNLVNSMSPARIEAFLTHTPVLMHFKADVSNFIQHLPNLIHLMEPLEVSFHQNLLRSLVLSFGRNPNHYFIDSVVSLISLEPDVLLKDFLAYIKSNEFSGTILALGPKLLANDKLRGLASDLKKEFVDVSLEVIANKDSQLLEFELACNTLVQLVQSTDGDELIELRKRIDEKKRTDYPKHYLKFLLPLSTEIKDLIICEEDSRSLRALKISCLSKHLQRSRESADLEIAVKMILSILKEDCDDVLTSVIVLVTDCFDLLLDYNREVTKEMLETIFKLPRLSWLQNKEILRCVMKIDCDLACSLVPDFDTIVIEKSLELCLSQNEDVSQLAISALKMYVNNDNLQKTLDKLMSLDLFDASAAMAFVQLIDALHSELQTSAFDKLAGYVVEVIGLHEDDPQIAGVGFNFLSNLGFFNVGVDFLNTCIDWIIRLQKAATQCTSSISSPLKGKNELPVFSSYIDTDVIAVSICKIRDEALKPLEACLKYFLSLASTSDKRAVRFMEDFVCLFPTSILPRALDYMASIPTEFHRIVSMVANCTNSPKQAAACCEFLCFSPPEFRYAAVDTIRFLIQHSKVTSGAIIFSFYRFLHFSNVHDAGDLLEKAKERLNQIELATIEAKFCVSDDDKMSNFTSKVPFSQWPVDDDDFCMSLQNRGERFKVSDFENFDFEHWKYVYDHIEMFEFVGLDEYSKKHIHSLKKFEPITEKADNRPKFTYQDVKKDERHTILVPILQNEYVFDKVLLKSFFQFTKYTLKQEQFNQLFDDSLKSKDPDLIRMAIEYSVRKGLSFNKKSLVDTSLDVIKSSPALMRALAHQLTKSDIELPQNIDINNFQFREFDFNSLAMSIDADQYVAKYFATMHITSSNLMHLTRVLTHFRFSGLEVIDFCVNNFQTILKSEKRFVACLRLLRVAIINVRKSPVLFGRLYPFLDSDVATVHAELSKILWPLFVDVEVNSGIVEWLERTNRKYPFFSPYLEALTVLYAYTECTVTGLTASSISSLLNNACNLPSVTMNGLNTVESLVKGSPTAWTLFSSIANDFFATAKRVGNRPIFDAKIDSILRIIIKRQDFHASMALLVPKIATTIFDTLPNTPSFAGRMAVLTLLIPHIPAHFKSYEDYSNKVMKIPEKDPLSLSVVLDSIKWSIRWEPSDSKRAEMTINCVNYAFKYVLQFNSDENIEAFMDSLWLPQCDFETAFTGIWKLSFLDFPMLKIVVMLHLFRKRCNEEQCEACKRMITFLYDSFDDKNRVKALELVFNGDPLGAATLSSS